MSHTFDALSDRRVMALIHRLKVYFVHSLTKHMLLISIEHLYNVISPFS